MNNFKVLGIMGMVIATYGCAICAQEGGKASVDKGKKTLDTSVASSTQSAVNQAEHMKSDKLSPPVQEDFNNCLVVIETNLGTIKFKFYSQDAPKTVENFVKLARQKFYDGLIFHRVIKNFVIQGGCPLGAGTGGPGYMIKAEFNSRKHVAGTVAMARAQNPDSAGSQFYICLADCPFLDNNYTVFGQVIEGMDVVLKIGNVKTTGNQNTGNFTPPFDKPIDNVIMKKVYIITQKK